MSLVIFEQKGPIGTLTLNQPESLNAMTVAMGEALQAVVPQINQNPELRVVVIKGSGRAFSAGGDLKFILEHTEKSPAENEKDMLEFYSRFLQLHAIQVPTIAQIHGPAIGAGFLIALACDLRYASLDAKMGANFAKLGLSSGMGGLYWLQRLVGPAVAAELLFTGRTLEATEAQELGLINQVFSADFLESEVQARAEQIAANAPLPLKIMKQGLQKTAYLNLQDTLKYEAWGQGQCFATQDLREGIAAMREKRPGNFSGK